MCIYGKRIVFSELLKASTKDDDVQRQKPPKEINECRKQVAKILARPSLGEAMTSTICASGEQRTRTDRPASAGRVSIQYTSSPSSAICNSSLTAPDATRVDVIGDFQDPQRAALVPVI